MRSFVGRASAGDGGLGERIGLQQHRRRRDHDAAQSRHAGAAAEEDREPAATEQGAQGRAGDLQAEGEGAPGGEPRTEAGLCHHCESIWWLRYRGVKWFC